MDPIIKYQYTYFIKSFTIEKQIYNKYIQKLLKDKKIKLKIFKKEKDVDLDSYFNNNIKNIMFKTLTYNTEKIKELENINKKTYSKVSSMPCICFEYMLEQNTQGKIGEENGIFFKIEKIEIICFSSGICFLAIKTYLDENATFSDVLNFNYKFKQTLTNSNEEINIQTETYKEKQNLNNILKELTGNNLNKEETTTLSYICVDGEEWNEKKDFSGINPYFTKLIKVMPENKNEENNIKIIDYMQYVKIGLNKNNTALITNSLNSYNYTKLPFELENQYLYTLIYTYYQKNMLLKYKKELEQNKYSKLKKSWTQFVKNEYLKKITNQKETAKLYEEWKKELELENTYLQIIEQYETAHKNERTRKKKRNSIIIWGIIISCIIVNIINITILTNITK